MRTAIAITASDIHLSHRCPVARSAEPDWYIVMTRQLNELRSLSNRLGAPILYAGDIFHTYNPPPRLINFAINTLPKGYAIPGQHDLAYHVYTDIHKTAYACLASANIIIDVLDYEPTLASFVRSPGEPDRAIYIHGFPWGSKLIANPEKRNPKEFHIALVHQYVWQKGSGYVGASIESSVKQVKEIAKTYDFVVFGDNHKGFKTGNIVNNGTFMRRAADEAEQQPRVSILWSDGEIEWYTLKSTEADKFADFKTTTKNIERSLDLSGFVEGLEGLGADKIDYVKALKQYCDTEGISDNVRATLMEATGE